MGLCYNDLRVHTTLYTKYKQKRSILSQLKAIVRIAFIMNYSHQSDYATMIFACIQPSIQSITSRHFMWRFHSCFGFEVGNVIVTGWLQVYMPENAGMNNPFHYT